MADLRENVKQSLRMFRKNPGFTLAAVAALALGIGANAAIFSVVNAVLLKPLSYPGADRIVEFLLPSPDGGGIIASNLACIPEFHTYQRQTNIFREVAAYDSGGPGFNLTGGRPEQVHGLHVTEGYFRLFGAPVILGRTFTPEEDLPHGGKVVVLSYGLWQRKFGGDSNVVGRAVMLGNEQYTIVGIVGKEFISDPAADVWLPFQFEPASDNMNHSFQVAGLLKPGVNLAQANAQMKLASAEFRRQYPATNSRQEFAVEPLRDNIVGNARKSLLLMLGACGLLLLIACANVANLLLVRATGRKREFAIRSALGAHRWHIVSQLLTESALLSAAGGICGLVLGLVGVRALLAIAPAGLPRIGESGSAIGVDWRVLGFTLAVSMVTGILFGLYPAFTASGSDMNTALKEGGNRSGTGFRESRTRALLVISEISLALILLVGSGLLVRSFIALRGVGPGFDPHNVLTMEMSLSGDHFHKSANVAQLSRTGRDRLNSLPGVEVSAAAYWLPIQVDDGLPFQIAGEPQDKDHQYGSRWMSISPGYLNAFKIPILRGRDFNENDSAAAPQVALINEAMANHYWSGRDAVGQQILISKGMGQALNESAPRIVGIVGDSHNAGLSRPSDPMVMVPVAQVTDGYAAAYSDIQPLLWIVRTRNDPHQSIALVTEQLRQASGGFPVAHVRTMEEVMGRSTARERFNMMLMTIFGVTALFLATIGIYGLMAFSVEQRTRELGIRMALGADRAAIRRLVVSHGMRLTVIGIALGLTVGIGLVRLMTGLLYGLGAWDPAAFIFAVLILMAVALVAVWLPSVRASRVDPAQALRAE
jgi:putative ABC transport system permease protein